MNRRALILEELQLTPLWVRRELLPDEDDAVPVTTPAADLMPDLEPQSPHPLPAVARTANKVMAPLIAMEAPRALSTPSEPKPAQQSAEEDARLQRIARMEWAELQVAVSECTACALCQTRQQAVLGTGHVHADLVVIGEAPGEDEDRQGEPFVGRAGKLLDNMLASIGEKRGERVYIANVLKCRPPNNRNPLPNEIGLCTPFLLRQLELIAPKAILAAGRFAAHTLLKSDAPLSALRSKSQSWRTIPLVVTYHPAYLLRNLPDKAKAWEDLLRIRDILDAPGHAAARHDA